MLVGNVFNLEEFRNQALVSVVPSLSELACSCGLQKQLIGRTKFCIHPKSVLKDIAVVGGTKNLQVEKIATLNPGLILANKEENTKDQIEWLAQRFPLWLTDVNTLADNDDLVQSFVSLSGFKAPWIDELSGQWKNLKNVFQQQSVLYLIWNKPFMAAGQQTFIHDVLTHIGLINCVSKSRYPVLEEEDLLNLNPQFVFLSSEPYPFHDKHCLEIKKLLPQSKVLRVDGELFSWYGSRLQFSNHHVNALVESLAYFVL